MRIAIVGGGFYGLCVAEFFKGHDVHIFEKESDCMTQGSNLCQCRIHSGMMYPRSLKTAISCIRNFKPFFLKFRSAIVSDFLNLYAVHEDSNISVPEYEKFAKEIGLEIEEYKPDFDMLHVQKVYKVQEYSIDKDKVKEILLSDTKATLHLNSEVYLNDLKDFDIILNSSYSGINNFLEKSGLEPLPLVVQKFEKIIAKDNLNCSITVVDGDFFSSLQNKDLTTYTGCNLSKVMDKSRHSEVFQRVREIIPDVKLEYIDSVFGEKCTMNGDRLSNVFKHNNRVFSILGGKLSNVFDLSAQINRLKREEKWK